MKATELMINDWVQVPFLIDNVENFNAYFQVKQLRDCDLDVIGFKELKYDEICPISLTPEILKRNGLVKRNNIDGTDFYYIKVLGGQYRFTISFLFFDEPVGGVKTLLKCWFEFNGGLNEIQKCNVLYVHELQYALRLCGIEKEIEP